ncbi:proton-coupled folate transporter-like [Aplysia californica]|uniref:Proton-coupled folate transporter-like n=1 Tax=Aplysia californica TaxID=6500 RepID=A0ABM1A6H6_APLCA|nr:proton-coupled folate transporter-like [Aplysia californica]
MPGSPYISYQSRSSESVENVGVPYEDRPYHSDNIPPDWADDDASSAIVVSTDSCLQSKSLPSTGGFINFHRVWLGLAVTLACYNTAFMATLPLTAQYLTHRVAHDWYNFSNFSKEIPCTKEANTSATRTRDEIQKVVSSFSLLINYASSLPAILTCLPYGTLSDHVGRKKMMFIPLIGGFVRMFVYLLVVKLELSLNYLFLGSAADGLCGSYPAMSMISAAAVADITMSSGGRALSFAVIEAILIISSAVANLSVGYFIMYEGYFYPTVMMSGLALIAFLVAATVFPETNTERAKASANPLKHLKRIVSFYTFAGSVRRRVLYRIGLFMFFLNIVVSIGRSPVETLYQLNSPFCWNSVKIGIFGAIQSTVQITCSVMALRILKLRLQLESIGILALLCAIAGFVIEGFAMSDWMLYAVFRSMTYDLYVLIPGALFASLSVVDAVCGILSFTTYSSVYLSTVQWYRGTVFFVMAGICAVNILLFLAFKKVNTKFDYEEITCTVEPPLHSARVGKGGLHPQSNRAVNETR